MLDLIYVHLDVTSNAVLTKGISHQDVTKSIKYRPENLLLLNPSVEDGEYDTHTGLKVIRGQERVEQYFSVRPRQKLNEQIKWMDFSDKTMIKELTPLEISELLYFGHMRTSLHSPFFYKLQNNFVFFELTDQMTRVYFRYIDEFYRILANKISQIMLEKVNDRKTFFRRSTSVEKLDSDVLKGMKSMLQEGIIFDFNQMILHGKEQKIPIYIIEDSLWKINNYSYCKTPAVAMLSYHTTKRIWRVEEDLTYMARSKQA